MEQENNAVHLAAFPLVGVGGAVGDEDRIRFHNGLDHAEFVGAQGRTGLGDIDNGIDQIGHFHLGGAPAEFDFGVHPAAAEKFFGQADGLGGHALPGQILDFLHR